MQERVIKVFYGTDALPYKDAERSVHFPIVGNAFQGASNTTEIRFYTSRIGGYTNQWITIGKKPNGKRCFTILGSPQTDSEIGEDYYSFYLNSVYTTHKGDLLLSLGGYNGEIRETDIVETYQLEDNSVIEMTGCIKLNIAYSTQIDGSDEEIDTWLAFLGVLGQKLDKSKGIIVYDTYSALESDYANYDNGQLFFAKDTKILYELDTTLVILFETYTQSQIDTLLNLKADKTYVDTELAKKVNLSGSNTISANNTFNGSNVFDNSPQTNEQISDASSDTKLTTKKYVKDLMDEHLGDYDTLKGRVDTIEEEIPSQASSSNQLADRDWVNSTINSLAAFYITKNAQGDPFATYSELASATTFYSGGQVRIPTRNDYCLVVSDENHDNASCRYIYQGTQWEFQFVVNETPFTADQLAAINSGITSALVSQINTNTNAITTINGKLPKIKDYVVATNLWQLVNDKYVAELDAGVDFVIDDNAMKIYTPTSNSDQLLRDTYGINVSSDATTQKFTFTCNIGNEAPSEVINFTIAQFGGN